MFDRLRHPETPALASPALESPAQTGPVLFRPALLLLAGLTLFTVGCAENFTSTATGRNPSIDAGTMQGKVYGGEQPIAGANVYLYAAGTTGYGKGSTLLAQTTTSSDGNGTFTLNLVTAADGKPTDYVCPSANAPVYLLSVGGNTQAVGATSNTNGAAVLMAALGACGNSGTLSVDINEISTAASVFALAQYINPGAAQGSMTLGSPGDYTLATIPQSATGLINAFNNVPLLENLATGTAVTSTLLTGTATAVAGTTVTATPETAKLNHLANILASCVNQATAAGTNCTTLFAAAVPPPNPAFTSQPTATFAAAVDTLQAAYYMATNPTDVAAITANGVNTSTANLATLYTLPPGASPFQPGLTAQPTDWTLGIFFTGGTSVCKNAANLFINYPYALGIDAGGNLWMANGGSSTAGATTQMSPNGVPLNCSGTIFGSRGGAVIDAAGNVWSTSNTTSAVYKINSSGTTTIPAAGKTYGIAADGVGNVFFTVPTASLYSLPSSATAATSPTSIGSVQGSSPYSLAVDTKGTVIVGQSGSGGSVITSAVPTKVGGSTYGTPVTLTAANNFAGVYGLAVDATGNFWVSNSAGASSGTATASGVAPGDTTSFITPTYVSATAGANNTVTFGESAADGLFTGGLATPRQIAIDGAGNVWAADNTAASSGFYAVTEISNTNLALSPTQTTAVTNTGGFTNYTQNGGFQKAAPFYSGLRGLAIDPSGNVWTSNTSGTTNTTVTMMVGAAVPVVTPIAQQLKTGLGPIKP